MSGDTHYLYSVRSFLMFRMCLKRSCPPPRCKSLPAHSLDAYANCDRLKIQRRQRCADKGCSRKFTYPSDIECPPSLYHPMFLSEDSSDSDSDSEDERPMPAKAPRKGRGRGKQPTMESWPTRSPGSDQHGNMPPLDNNKRRFLDFADTYLKKSKMVVPSAKIEGVQKLIREWQETAPDDKIISKGALVDLLNLYVPGLN